jgi:hypothetical protein
MEFPSHIESNIGRACRGIVRRVDIHVQEAPDGERVKKEEFDAQSHLDSVSKALNIQKVAPGRAEHQTDSIAVRREPGLGDTCEQCQKDENFSIFHFNPPLL